MCELSKDNNIILNKTNNVIIHQNVKIANNLFGLMFCKKKNFNYGLIFDIGRNVKNFGVQMFFVSFKINVIFLNENKEIVDIKKDLLPLQVYFTKKECRYVIELPEDCKYCYEIGDEIDWSDKI